MKNFYKTGRVRKAEAANNKVNETAASTHSNEGVINNKETQSNKENTDTEDPIIRRAYQIAPEWKISVIAKRKFMALPSIFQNGEGKEACVKEALAAHKELIPDPTRYWIWLVDETRKLVRVWDFEDTCKEAGMEPLTVAQHLILEGKATCNAIRLEGLQAYGSNIRMFVEPLFKDEFKLFSHKAQKGEPVQTLQTLEQEGADE